MDGRFNLFKRLGQRGQSILIVALSLPIFMFLLAIVFDVGMYFVQASRLQNIADSAALAGVGAYTNNCVTKLISKPSDMDFDDSFETKFSGKDYTFDVVDDKDEADEHAAYYIRKNSNNSHSINDADTGLWYAPIVFTLVDHSTASYVGLYCYRVDLTEEVPLNFAKYFGFDSFDVKASAVAVAVPTKDTIPDDDKIDEFIKAVNANIYKTAPNLYYESIFNSSSERTYDVTSTDSVTGEESTDVGEIYGKQNDKYFTSHITDYTKSENHLAMDTTLPDDTIAWKEGDDEYCADPIEGKDQLGLKGLTYTINRELIQDKSSTGKETTSLYLDRPNTSSNGLGTPYRATYIDITGENLSDDKETPLYMRVESEPILVSGNATLVQPITITINGDQEKPMVVAYDGPDPNREEKDTPKVDVTTGMTYKKSGNSWVVTHNNYKNRFGSYDPNNLVLTSSTVSAPITINLDHDFKGVIYAPYSKVIVYGSGKIDGFILAAEIEDHGTSSNRKSHTTFSSIPNWYAEYDYKYDSSKQNWFKYTVYRVDANYSVIYDVFHNYTWTELGD